MDQEAKGRAAFISHSSVDGELAQQLCVALERRGFTCWVAPRDLWPAESWALGCLRGIAECDSFVLLASESGLASGIVKDEILQARMREKPMYTVIIPPAKVKGEVDLYLARFHWLQLAGRNAEELSEVLASVLGRKREWEEVADGPSFKRTMRYRPVAFAKLVAAMVVGPVIVLGAAAYALNLALELDFRRIGWVDVSPSAADREGKAELNAQVWLAATGASFRDVRWETATAAATQSFSAWSEPSQVGNMEPAVVTLDKLDKGAGHLWSCLIVVRNGIPWRVTQEFEIRPGDGEFRVAETAEKRVRREDGSPCGNGR